LKQIFKSGGVPCIKLGDAVLEFNAGFKFFITTKLANPHYLPEVSTKVTLVNFMITPEGLKDQLLGIVVAKERADLEEKKVQLTIESAENAKKLQDCEDQILKVLAEAEDILDDEAGVKILNEAKVVSDDVNRKQAAADKLLSQISTTRDSYIPAATLASVLFFFIDSLSSIDPMYQYSLRWFIDLYSKCIEVSERPDDPKAVGQRLELLNQAFKVMVYNNICRSLFVAHKLLFSFTMCTALLEQIEHRLDQTELRFLLTGGVGTAEGFPSNPDRSWISDKMWEEVCRLDGYEAFHGLCRALESDAANWKAIFDNPDPQGERFPGSFGAETFRPAKFRHLLILRAIRPDKLVPAVANFVAEELGRDFVEPPPFSLPDCHEDSSCTAALIFILCPGQDPMNQLRSFALTKGIKGPSLMTLSLGQGQDKKAESYIDDGVGNGAWVVLQNCHLFTSWMPKLEKICDEFTVDTVHRDFRLWLTSAPSPSFPVSVLQNGVKMINEPPKGLRANILGSYLADPVSNKDFFEDCVQPEAFRKLLYGLCTFHAIIQDRRKFGPLGWNIQYEFNESDLRICVRQLQIFLNTYDFVPYKALVYLTGECNYGGRVTDDWDRRTLRTILSEVYCERILDPEYTFDDPQYTVPPFGEYESYLEHTKALPLVQKPGIFGMDDNADITKDKQETDQLLGDVLKTQVQSGGGGGGVSREDIIAELAKDIKEKLPPDYDIEEVMLKYPTLYDESMNTVLVQEMIRYNRLTVVVRSSVGQVLKALKGLVVMSSQLEEVCKSFFDGKVPPSWLSSSFSSLKPLGSYIVDMMARLAFFRGWYDNGPPAIFWFSGFYFPPAFLTGALQNFARRNQFAIDTVDYDFHVVDGPEPLSKADAGVYIKGLFLEGARWDCETHELSTQKPKVLLTPMPVLYLETMKKEDILSRHGPKVLDNGDPLYKCPVYKTLVRKGVLATTGHSTNFVLPIRLPTSKSQAYWIKRGTALICATDT